MELHKLEIFTHDVADCHPDAIARTNDRVRRGGIVDGAAAREEGGGGIKAHNFRCF